MCPDHREDANANPSGPQRDAEQQDALTRRQAHRSSLRWALWSSPYARRQQRTAGPVGHYSHRASSTGAVQRRDTESALAAVYCGRRGHRRGSTDRPKSPDSKQVGAIAATPMPMPYITRVVEKAMRRPTSGRARCP
jgi:hypothetical protein